MKKALLLAVLLAAIAATAFVVIRKTLIHQPRAAELVPAETILFAQLPDTVSSARRFTQTALWRIIREPEMQEFFESSERKSPIAEEWQRLGGLIARVLPREGIRCRDFNRWCGANLCGRLCVFRAAEARRGNWPRVAQTAASEMADRARRTSQTMARARLRLSAAKDFVIADVFADGWYFIADDLALLECTLDRLDQKPEMAGQFSSRKVTSSTSHRAVATGRRKRCSSRKSRTLAERLDAILVASGQKTAPQELDELKKVQAVAAATKFDGANCRDSIFVLRPEARRRRRSPDTRWRSVRPRRCSITRWPAGFARGHRGSSPMLAMIPGWDAFNQALTSENLTLADLPKASARNSVP
jgi:hypothetical protein